MQTHDDEISLTQQVDALKAIDAQRKRLGMSMIDLEFTSGVSISSFYAYGAKRGRRNPGLGNLVALAESVGFEVIMRPKETPGG